MCVECVLYPTRLALKVAFGEILKKKNDYDITIKDDGIEINNFIGINDFENGEKWTNLMNKLKDEIIKMI